MIFSQIILNKLPDGAGPYAETNFSYWIVEPWNAASSLAFLIPVIYWLIKLRGNYRSYPFLTACILLLTAGGLGSTLFHAFRNSTFLFLMDILPMLVVTMLLSIYFWRRVLPNYNYVILVAVVFFLSQFIFFNFLPASYAVNISYFFRGTFMFLPLLLTLRKIDFQFSNSVFLAILFFVVSLFFRTVDHSSTEYFYMGTHWLWHVFSSIGCYFIADFLYKYAQLRKQAWVVETEEEEDSFID